MAKVFRSQVYILFLSILFSCANQTQPTGGPKDEEPPVLESSSPRQGELNVEAKQIELDMNEAIKLNSFKEQLIITPRIDAEYTVKYRKNKVIITFDETLPDSTTYTFNFREAIQDITEGNSPENLKLAFSTGSYLDSMSVSGQVFNLLTDGPGENITVALYTLNDTLDIFSGPPLYFTKTNAEGIYSFENIKIDTYHIYAFDDNNKNLTNQSKSESYGFSAESLVLDSSVTELNIPIQLLNIRELELQSFRQSGTVFTLKFNKHVVNYSLQPADSSLTLQSNFTDNSHETIQIFNTVPIADSLMVFVDASDSLQLHILDTAWVRFEETQRKPLEFKHDLKLSKVITDQRLVQGSVIFSKPITTINLDSTYIYIDSLHIYPLDSTHFTWNFYQDHMDFSYLLDRSLFEKPDETKEDQSPPQSQPDTTQPADTTQTDSLATDQPKPELSPHIRFAPNSFISAQNDSSQNITQDFTFAKPDQFGTIILEVETQEPNFFIQLLDSRDQVVQEKYNLTNFEFKYIEPGTYRIRILIDSNQNGQWDPGNILLNTEPEPVLFYHSSTDQQEITIRANFEIVPDPIVF